MACVKAPRKHRRKQRTGESRLERPARMRQGLKVLGFRRRWGAVGKIYTKVSVAWYISMLVVCDTTNLQYIYLRQLITQPSLLLNQSHLSLLHTSVYRGRATGRKASGNFRHPALLMSLFHPENY